MWRPRIIDACDTAFANEAIYQQWATFGRPSARLMAASRIGSSFSVMRRLACSRASSFDRVFSLTAPFGRLAPARLPP